MHLPLPQQIKATALTRKSKTRLPGQPLPDNRVIYAPPLWGALPAGTCPLVREQDRRLFLGLLAAALLGLYLGFRLKVRKQDDVTDGGGVGKEHH